MGITLGKQRLPPLPNPPPPNRPVPPPPRPTASLPADGDEVNTRIFGDEFETIPLPDVEKARKAAPVCTYQNMTYIRSNIPTSAMFFRYEDFFERMAKHQWHGAQPLRLAPRQIVGSAHRPATAVDKSKPLYGKAATDWDKIRDLERVNAYAFRGDKRRVTEVRAANGFHPPSSRTDDRYLPKIASRFVAYMKSRFNKDVNADDVIQYNKGQGAAGKVFVEYEIWRALLDAERFHIGRMVTNEFLRGYTSTSRSIMTALNYCNDDSDGDGYKAPSAAVYALHTEGGFLLPPRAQHVHGYRGSEAEIAHPGSIPWLKVMAFRTKVPQIGNLKVDGARYRSNVIFVRKGFRQLDPHGCVQVVATLGSVDKVAF